MLIKFINILNSWCNSTIALDHLVTLWEFTSSICMCTPTEGKFKHLLQMSAFNKHRVAFKLRDVLSSLIWLQKPRFVQMPHVILWEATTLTWLEIFSTQRYPSLILPILRNLLSFPSTSWMPTTESIISLTILLQHLQLLES